MIDLLDKLSYRL